MALVLLTFAGGADAQPRRDPALQPVAEVRAGDLILGLGVAHGLDEDFPLSGLSGDLTSIARVTAAYGLADRVLLEIRGDAWRVLSVDAVGEPSVPLDPGVADGTTGDAGDFRIGLTLAPLGGSAGFSGGGQIEVKLPNSDETKGIGPNTTDVRLAALASYGAERWRATGSLGVEILEAPLESFEQNDVLRYAFELLVRATPGVRLALGVDGRASTRGRVPTGTEDVGSVSLSADLMLGSWVIDLGLATGLADRSPDWSAGIGVAWTRLSRPRDARDRRPGRRRRP